MQKQELTHDIATTYLEMGDHIFALAEKLGLGDDWAAEQQHRISNEIKTKTGIDLIKEA